MFELVSLAGRECRDRVRDLRGHLVDRPITVDPREQPALLVIVEQRLRLCKEDIEPPFDRLWRVVFALDQSVATTVTDVIDPWRIHDDVEGGAADGANTPAEQSNHE